MCKKAINVISPALDNITEADNLLKVKNVLALFIQTMDVSGQCQYFLNKRFPDFNVLSCQSWGYSVEELDQFLLVLFEKYSERLKKEFSIDFKEVFLDLPLHITLHAAPLMSFPIRLSQVMITCQCLSTLLKNTITSSM